MQPRPRSHSDDDEYEPVLKDGIWYVRNVTKRQTLDVIHLTQREAEMTIAGIKAVIQREKKPTTGSMF